MAFKIILLCLTTLLVQSITCQCLGNIGNAGLGLAGNGYLANPGLGYAGLNPAAISNGGGLVVTSTSPIAPTGISVLAENLQIEGPVAVNGQLPLLSVVALEGALPTGGLAGTSYGCGNGNVGIVSEIGAGSGVNGLGVGPAGLGAAGLGSVGLGATGLGPVGLGAANLGSVGLGAAGLGPVGLGAAGLGPAGLGLGAAGLGCGRIL